MMENKKKRNQKIIDSTRGKKNTTLLQTLYIVDHVSEGGGISRNVGAISIKVSDISAVREVENDSENCEVLLGKEWMKINNPYLFVHILMVKNDIRSRQSEGPGGL